MEDRKHLAKLICDATQKTNYKCADICNEKGCCAYCLTISDHILHHSKNKGVCLKDDLSMEWKYSESGNCWIASRPMPDGVCNFVYIIHPMMGGGYTAEASNTAYGACRVAVRNKNCVKESIFNDLAKLMKNIEHRNTLWLYTSHCNCIGEITKQEK